MIFLPRLHAVPVAISLVSLAPVLCAQVARDTATLPATVVTATRLPTPQSATVSSVTVIRGDDLRARGVPTVLDALRTIPGASLAQSGSAGSVASLFLRGGESDYVKVLVDGVAVNDPGGAFDFANLTTANVDRIEIVRGPASVLYGSDAVTGVVQIFTRRGGQAPRATLEARAGSLRSRNIEGAVLGAGAGLSYSADAAYQATAGALPFNNQYRNSTLSGALRFAPAATSDATLSARYTDANFHYPTNSSGVPEDSNAFRTERRLAVGLDAGRFFTPKLEARLQLGSSQTDGRSEDRPDNAADTIGFFGYLARSNVYRRSGDARVNAYLSPLAIATAGAEYTKQRDDNSSVSLSQFGDYPSDPFFRSRENVGYYAQIVGSALERLSYTLGARRDDNQRFGVFNTYRVGAGVQVLSNTRVRAAAGTSFKEPTFYEQFATGFVEGNPALAPERSRSWEVALEQSALSGALSFDVTYFDQQFRDLVEYANTPKNEPDYLNVAAANASGWEVETRFAPMPALSLAGNYTHLRTRVVDPGVQTGAAAYFVAGNRLIRRPTHLANASADLRLPNRASLGVQLNYVGDRDDRDFSSTPKAVVLPAYTKVDVSGALPLARVGHRGTDLTLTARIENVFNRKYQQVYGYQGVGRLILIGGRAALGF